MPKLSWPELIAQHPCAHLVIGALPDDKVDARTQDFADDRLQFNILVRVARALALGDYALTINREKGGTQIFIALADDEDAARVAGITAAAIVDGSYSSWATQCRFLFNEEAIDALEAILPSLIKTEARPAGRPRGSRSLSGV